MAGQYNAYKVQKLPDGWKGMAKDNHIQHIGAMFEANAQRGSNQMVQLFSAQHGFPSYESLLNSFGVKEFEDDREIKWDVIGATDRNIPLVEARDENGEVVRADRTGNIGANTAPFELVFAIDWFADQEVIVGNLNEQYPFRILGPGRQEGINTVYKVELLGGNTTGIPAERLLRGEKFSVETAYVERELSRKAGEIRFATPVSMRNDWSTIRIYHKESGKRVLDKLMVSIPVVKRNKDTGKISYDTVNHWMQYVDYELERQFASYKSKALVYGRSNRNANGEYMNFGKSGEAIRIGSGLFEQMEFGNSRDYNEFSLDLIEDMLEQICIAGNVDMADRTFTLHTGQYGAKQFNKAVTQEVSGWHPFQFNGDALGVVKRVENKAHVNALQAGFQFTDFIAANNLHIKLCVDPIYDDPIRNKIEHPKGGLAMSYRYDIFDMGTSQERNVVKCRIAGTFGDPARGYEAGMRNPFLKTNSNNFMSYDEDSAAFHKMETFGVVVYDPTRTASLIPSVLLG